MKLFQFFLDIFTHFKLFLQESCVLTYIISSLLQNPKMSKSVQVSTATVVVKVFLEEGIDISRNNDAIPEKNIQKLQFPAPFFKISDEKIVVYSYWS